MQIFAGVRALGGMESKIINVGFEISFGIRILIFFCPLYVLLALKNLCMAMHWRVRRPVAAAGLRL